MGCPPLLIREVLGSNPLEAQSFYLCLFIHFIHAWGGGGYVSKHLHEIKDFHLYDFLLMNQLYNSYNICPNLFSLLKPWHYAFKVA